MTFQFDAVDDQIKTARVATRDRIDRPRLGDFVQFPTGELERFSHDWGDDLQTSPSGSFYLCSHGQGDFSGGLNSPTPLDKLTLTGTTLPGSFWFFHHDSAGPGRAVYFTIPCRVYSTTAKYEGFIGASFRSKAIEAPKEIDAAKR